MSPEFCAQCLSESGPFVLRPHGKGDAMVNVCDRCENEHPREGRYNFSEATRVIPSRNGHHTRSRQ